MSMLPDYRFVRFKFYAPAGFENVHVKGAFVTGRWKSETTRFYGDKEKLLAERFANSSGGEQAILRFTSKYGPLSGSAYTEPEFRFSVDSWRGSQKEFQKFWRVLASGGPPGGYQPLEGSTFEFRNGWLHFRCGDLWTFMTFELLSKPEMVRICMRPGCIHPYFVAQHGKERYCSTDCANWAQSQWKKQWHEEQRLKRIRKEK